VSARNTTMNTLVFSAAVCVVCAVLVSTAAVTLRDRQAANAELDRRRNILVAAGVMPDGERLPPDETNDRFEDFEVAAVDMQTGEEDPSFESAGYDARRAQGDPQRSRPAPRNEAQVGRVPIICSSTRNATTRGSSTCWCCRSRGKASGPRCTGTSPSARTCGPCAG
jgi:Na+-transporting NADH:ubiquinone oxidoreductase subunit NqrC